MFPSITNASLHGCVRAIHAFWITRIKPVMTVKIILLFANFII